MQPCTDDNTLRLVSIERVGGVETKADIFLCRSQQQPNMTTANVSSSSGQKYSSNEAVEKMFSNLCDQLKRYVKQNLFPYNINSLVQSLERLLERYKREQ
jgi:hypothetical protein